MRKLTDVDYKSLDLWLFKYRDIDRQIAIRKLEIQDVPNADENIGGGKSSDVGNPTEKIVLLYSKDVRLQALYSFKKAVDTTKSKLDKELTSIFDLRWGVGSCNTWEEIAHKVGYNKKYIYRKRNHILKIFAEKIGVY